MKKINVFGWEVNPLFFGFIFLLAFSLVGGCTYRVWWWTDVPNYEIAYLWDKSNGTRTRLRHTGWVKSTPYFQKIYTIDPRPMQIRIEANNRVLNAMLVRFDTTGEDDFFEKHGLDDYNQKQLGEILKSYAYEGMASGSYNKDSLQKKYKFLKILGGTSGNINQGIIGPQTDTAHANN